MNRKCISNPVAAAFSVAGSLARLGLGALVLISLLEGTQVFGANWTNLAGGSWNNAGNWAGGSIPNGVNAIADFSTLDLTSDTAVTLDGSKTVGSLLFGDATPSNDWFLNPGSGGLLTLSVSSGAPTITVNNQTATIGAVVSGTKGFAKIGGGTLILAATNTFTGTAAINGGRVTFMAPNVFSACAIAGGASAEIRVASGTVDPPTVTFSGSGTLVKSGAGTLVWSSGVATFGFGMGALIDIQGGTVIGGSWSNENWTSNSASMNIASGAVYDGVESYTRIDALTGAGVFQGGFGGTEYSTLGVAGGSGVFSGTVQNAAYNKLNLVKTGAGTQTFSGTNYYTGYTTIKAGRLVFQNYNGSSAYNITNGAALEFNAASGTMDLPTATFSGAGTLIKSGAGTLQWGGGAGTFALGAGSLIDVQGGILVGANSGNEIWTANQSSLNIASGATFRGVEANVRVDALTGAGTFQGGYAGTETVTLGLNGGSGTFSGSIQNFWAALGLVKEGAGMQILSGTNTYTGVTTVNQGTLQVLGSLSPGSAVTVGAAGTLAGTGTVGGPVTVNGNLAPGTSSMGSLTFASPVSLAGTTTLRVTKSGNALSNDTVVAMNGVNYGGALVVTNIGGTALALGDTFQLFSADVCAGAFSSITLPGLPAGLIWNTSQLLVNGRISVSGPLTLTTIAVSPASVTLSPHGTQQFTATAYYQNGEALPVQPTLTWSYAGNGSGNSFGFFTGGYAAGTATITACSGDIQGSASVIVSGYQPMSWTGSDIGSVGASGGTSYTNGIYTVNGSGAGISGSSDAFQFSSQFLQGDGEIRARVTSQTSTNSLALAGVMVRDGLNHGAANVLVALAPGGFTFQSRTTAGGSTAILGSAGANTAPNNWVRLVRSGSLFTAYVSADGTNWTPIGTSVISLSMTLNAGLAVSSVNNAAVNTAIFDNVSVTPFPSPWVTADIGNTVQLGSAEYYNGVYTVKGAGTVGNTADKFRFLYQTTNSTSSQIIVRISTLQNTGTSARLGVMIRSGLAANSPYAFMGVDGTGAYKFQGRSTTGGATTTTSSGSGTAPNIWVKLVQGGSTFTGYTSGDGVTWTQVQSLNITIGSTVYLGIADASGSTSGLNTSVFDSVSGTIKPVPTTQTVLTSFENAGQLGQILGAATVNQSTQHATDGSYSLKVAFPNQWYPNVTIPAAGFFATTNWNNPVAFMFDAYNADTQPMTVTIRIHNADGTSSDITVTLPSGLQQRVAVGIHLPNHLLMDSYPLNEACHADQSGLLPLWSGFVGDAVSSIEFVLGHPGRVQTLYLDNFCLVPVPALCNIVDQYGQYTLLDWPGKVHSDQELITEHATEAANLAAQLAALQSTTDRDSYGGWAAGPTLEATGWFRTQKLNGKWWLVTPSGHLFWSVGIDCIGTSAGTPCDSTDSYMFSWLPAVNDPLYAFSGNNTWPDWYLMNLYRVYGTNYLASYQNRAGSRLRAWGFNTLGAWSVDSFCAQLQIPFAAYIDSTHPASFDWGNGLKTDYYSSMWAAGLEANVSSVTAQWATNYFCLGYFVDNEIGWTGVDALPVNALALTGTAPVKVAFTTLLKNKYTTIANLDAAWGTSFHLAGTNWMTNFQNVSLALPAVGSRNTALEADLSALLSAFANQYYSTVNTLLKKYAPNQLYLGSRFTGFPADEVAIAAGNNCDVVSYNFYGTSDSISSRDPQIGKFNKPVLIGEFSFMAYDRGLFQAGNAATQQDRATQYAAYINTLLAEPWSVGAHWFQSIDEPLTSRGDGENANEGFVSVADVPYPELTGKATMLNTAIYTTRSAVAVATNSTIISVAFSGTNLLLNWPADHLGWILTTQTNRLNLGLSLLPSDWMRLPNSMTNNQFSIPLSSSSPAGFYRLVNP